MTNGCPLVCMTALAISNERALIRSMISTQTAARASGPTERQTGIAACAASTSSPTSTRG